MLTQSGASSFFIQGGGGGDGVGGIAKDERSFGFKATNHGRKRLLSRLLIGEFSAHFSFGVSLLETKLLIALEVMSASSYRDKDVKYFVTL